MTIVLEPTLYGLSVTLNEPVNVTVTRPDKSLRQLRLTRDLNGLYQAPFNETALVGPYRISADVSATTNEGNYITRTRQMTGVIFVPGSTGGGSGQGDGNDQVAEALEKCCREIAKRLDLIIRQKAEGNHC